MYKKTCVKVKVGDELGVDKSSGASMKFTPWLKVFSASDPEIVKCLMTLKPSQVKKAGLSDMLFSDDPNGFMGGILYDEGEAWQRSRKILSEEFNQDLVMKLTFNFFKFFIIKWLHVTRRSASLDSYIDKMDDSAIAFVERLIEFGDRASMTDIASLINHMTLEVLKLDFDSENRIFQVIIKTIFGDDQFDLVRKRGDSSVNHAFEKMSTLLLIERSCSIKLSVYGFCYKLNNLLPGFLIQIPLFGPMLARIFIKDGL